MVNVEKQVHYWKTTAENDWTVIPLLLTHGRLEYALFFTHLVLEKLLKGHVVKTTGNLAPKIHDLVQLAKLSHLDFPDGWIEFFSEMNEYYLEGRYPSLETTPLDRTTALEDHGKAKEVYLWLMQKL